MSRYTITLVRDKRNLHGILATNTIGTDGFNAISSVPGVADVEIESESEGQVEISYRWTGTEPLWTTQEHLSKFGLTRKVGVKAGT